METKLAEEVAVKQSKFSKIVTVVKQSLNGEQQDYTQGSIPRAVILLAIPMILELSLESVFAIVDMFFVSKLGPEAIATVGFTESFVTIIYSIAMGLSIAATATVARRVGEKNPEGAGHAGAQSLIVALIISIVLSIAGVTFATDILEFMGASKEVVTKGVMFTRIMLGGEAAIMLLFLINGIFRGAGNAAMAMKSLWIASGINIILCPIFIHFFGLKGAAIATVTGRSMGVVYQCYHLFKGDSILKINRNSFKIDTAIIKSLATIAWPATLQFLIGSGSWIVLTRLVAETGGTDAAAGYQIAFRNFIFFILPAWGLSNAAATLVGQNLGANQPLRAEQSVWLTTKYNAVFTTLVMLLFIFFSEPIVKVFTNDKAVLEYGTKSLQIIGSGYIFYGVAMVLTQAMNGAGDTKMPTIINFVGCWLFQIPFAYFLSEALDMKSTGVFISIPASQVLITIMSWYYFKKGKWKKVIV